MTRIASPQLFLELTRIQHLHAAELATMSAVLDELQCHEWIVADLLRSGVSAQRGRRGMTGPQVLRTMICKQMKSLSYDDLAFHLADSQTYRQFCRIRLGGHPPSASTLQRNIKAVQATTFKRISSALVTYAQAHNIEDGQRVRCDSTVIEAAIHEPTDSSLLVDCVRVLTRLGQATRALGFDLFPNHLKLARRRGLAISHTAKAEHRLPLYRSLLEATTKTMAAAQIVVDKMKTWPQELLEIPEVSDVYLKLQDTIAMTAKVIHQTKCRVIDLAPIPAAEKIVSIFEPHTDIIRKDRRDTLYGHKVFLTTGASGLIVHCTIERGNPADASLATSLMEQVIAVLGKIPEQATFDGGFTSIANLAAIKALGIRDVAFSKSRGIAVKDMVKHPWMYQQLRNFRAGIESTISFLKRCFGWDRCAWRSFESFQAYSWASVIACNLLVIARHQLQ
jgi:transposase, IS5 family